MGWGLGSGAWENAEGVGREADVNLVQGGAGEVRLQGLGSREEGLVLRSSGLVFRSMVTFAVVTASVSDD